MRSIAPLFCLLLLLFSVISCQRPACNNTNPVFSQFAPDSKEYKNELARQIRSVGVENLRYWYDGYRKEATREFIIAHIQGETLCTKGELLVTNWDEKIQGLRGSDRGYSGAELSGLKLDIQEGPAGAILIYKGLDRIVD